MTNKNKFRSCLIRLRISIDEKLEFTIFHLIQEQKQFILIKKKKKNLREVFF
jgi:hypothetical protein